MPRNVPDHEYRLRLQRLAHVLRRFRIVDRDNLSALFRRRRLPTVAALAKHLRTSQTLLPPTITPEFVAECILSEITSPDPDTAAWCDAHKGLRCGLGQIEPGKAHASRYHNHIFELLEAIFEGILHNPTREQGINGDLGRIDIVFDNRAKEGFFAALREQRHIPCDHILFECKNSGDDPGNPEYDQLSGRLNPQRGQVGFIVCREVNDRKRAQQHCRSRLTKGEYISVLDDRDIRALLQCRRSGDLDKLDAILFAKLRDLHM